MADPISTGSTSTRRTTMRRRLSAGAGVALAVLLLMSLAALVIGISRGSDSADTASTSSDSGGVAAESESAASRAGEVDAAMLQRAGADSAKGAQPTSLPLSDRAVIRTAAMRLLADDVATARNELLTITETLGGYVADERSEADRGGRLRSADLTLQVPTDDLDLALDRMADVGTKISLSQSTDDVTEQVVDVDSRVNSAEAALRRVRLLLGEARSLGDVIRLEQVLSSRQADLESLLSQQESLAARTSMASLRVTVSEPGTDRQMPAEDDEAGFLAGLSAGWDALKAGYVALATLAGALLPTAVVLALIAVATRLVMRRGRWNRRPTRSAA